MRKYERPVVMINEELAEGVYAASGADCYTVSAKLVQKLPYGNQTKWLFDISGVHNATDGHHTQAQTLVITFNKPVVFSEAQHYSSHTGDNTNTLTINYIYHNNAGPENIGLGNLGVLAEEGLEVEYVEFTSCARVCNHSDH